MKHNLLVKYLIITYLISWIFWGTLIVLINNSITTYSNPFGFIIFALGGLGPTIAAIVVQKKRTLKSIIKYIFNGNYKSILYLLLFCILLTITIYLSSRKLNPNLPVYFFPLYLIIMTFIGGGLEELGWRGTMQPFLEKIMPFPVSVLLTSITWSLWHLPLWFVAGSSQQSIHFAAFAAFGLTLSFAMALIYKKTKCVFFCCVFHGFSNTLMSYFIVETNWIIIFGCIMIIIFSLIMWNVNKRKFV